ncbi:unnamed protein product [Clonostachys rosea]|uniref:Carboxylic ester hydrolase n=1 Tax=Bionectria ochroleuca TaxID=29856 RepID=A0ABY6U2C4_BIOOC|nr:unnamed protein product [Clonostachys rosea]
MLTKRLFFLFAFVDAISASTRAHQSCHETAAKLQLASTTILFTSYHQKGESIPLPGTAASCSNTLANITANLCRVVFDTASSSSSSIRMEAWLPDEWNGRFLATGGGGLGGCIDYPTVQNGASLGFATFGTNGGHNGSVGFDFFLNKSESIIDFGHRAIHIEAEVGKALSMQYYGSSPRFSYYVGCSTGGRQGLSTATHYPNDFDGMVVGAPGVEWIRIVTQWYLMAQRFGWPNTNASEYVSFEQFQAIASKIVELYDEVDGVKDGILDNPSHLHVDPQLFACGTGILNSSLCLKNAQQVRSFRLAYQPMVDLEGNFVYPGFPFGVDVTSFAQNEVNGSAFFPVTQVRDYFRGIVYNGSNWSDLSLTAADVEYAVKLNAGLTNTGISEAQLGKFREAGGKIISFHGRADQKVPSELSEWYYNGAMANINATLDDMHDFYRLFFIPGMAHCRTGPGAWNVGQVAPLDPNTTDAEHNTILAIQNWVEQGHAPDYLVGTKYQGDLVSSTIKSQRKHCVYPLRSKWDGVGNTTDSSSWNCVAWDKY